MNKKENHKIILTCENCDAEYSVGQILYFFSSNGLDKPRCRNCLYDEFYIIL